nr:MAG TPA: hypothetical protein [Caudoviricetes sp.]
MLKAVGSVEVSLDKVITGVHVTGVHYDSVFQTDFTARKVLFPEGYSALDALDNPEESEKTIREGITGYLEEHVKGSTFQASTGNMYRVEDYKVDAHGLMEDGATFVVYLEEILSES